jgi:hypothetical protein
MKSISRRQALTAGAAAGVAAALPAGAAQAEDPATDAELIAKCNRLRQIIFCASGDAYRSAMNVAVRRALETGRCPPYIQHPETDPAGHARYLAFVLRHDQEGYYARWLDLLDEETRLAHQIFDTSPKTFDGLFAKLSIADLALGDGVQSGIYWLGVLRPDRTWLVAIMDDVGRLERRMG